MSDAFLPGNGFDTYETQDKVLVSMDGSVDCGVVVRILHQRGCGRGQERKEEYAFPSGTQPLSENRRKTDPGERSGKTSQERI